MVHTALYYRTGGTTVLYSAKYWCLKLPYLFIQFFCRQSDHKLLVSKYNHLGVCVCVCVLGVRGVKGHFGSTGATGVRGDTGDTGDTGATGVQQAQLIKRRVTRQVPRCLGDAHAQLLSSFDYSTLVFG